MFHTVKSCGIRWCCGLSAAVALALSPVGISAGEHPAEHPQAESAGLTKETIAKAVGDYVQKETKLKGGYFLVYDQVANKPLVLALDRVHKDRLSKVSEGVYFACADFKTPEDRLYDLDIFMKQTESGFEVTEISIHKEEGKARYNWVEKGGIWTKKGI